MAKTGEMDSYFDSWTQLEKLQVNCPELGPEMAELRQTTAELLQLTDIPTWEQLLQCVTTLIQEIFDTYEIEFDDQASFEAGCEDVASESDFFQTLWYLIVTLNHILKPHHHAHLLKRVTTALIEEQFKPKTAQDRLQELQEMRAKQESYHLKSLKELFTMREQEKELLVKAMHEHAIREIYEKTLTKRVVDDQTRHSEFFEKVVKLMIGKSK